MSPMQKTLSHQRKMAKTVSLMENRKMSTPLNRKEKGEMFQMIALRFTPNIAHLMKNETKISLMKLWQHRDQYHVLQENRDCHSEVEPQTKLCLKIIKLFQAQTNLKADHGPCDLLTNRISVFSQSIKSVHLISINTNWRKPYIYTKILSLKN